MDYAPGIELESLEDMVKKFRAEDIIEREIASGQNFGPFHQQWQRDRAPTHIRRMLRKARNDPFFGAGQNFVSPGASKPVPSSFASINTTTTETCLWSSPIATALQTTY